VTGVRTCALPIFLRPGRRVLVRRPPAEGPWAGFGDLRGVELPAGEPVGPECRAREPQGWVGLPVRVLGRRLRYTHRFSHRLWRVELWEVRLRQSGPGGPALRLGGGVSRGNTDRYSARPGDASLRAVFVC